VSVSQTYPPLEQRPLEGTRAYAEAIDTLVPLAGRWLRIFDRSLGRDYNSVERTDRLGAFLLADRRNRLLIVVHEPEGIRRECPRLVSLQRRFGHSVFIHRTQSLARKVSDPFCIADASHYARRFHADQPRGVLALNDFDGAAELVRRFEEIWEASQPAVSGTTLGL